MAADYTNGVYFPTLEDFHWSRQWCTYFTYYPSLPDPLTDWQNFFPEDTSIIGSQSYQTGIVFAFPGLPNSSAVVAFEHQSMPVTAEASRNQTLLLSGSGEYSVYDAASKHRIIEVKLRNITMTQLHHLYIFLVNIAKGALNTFDYLDESGTKYTVRWIDKTFIRETHHIGNSVFYADVVLHLWVQSLVEDYVT
jgi:hypothetical protein